MMASSAGKPLQEQPEATFTASELLSADGRVKATQKPALPSKQTKQRQLSDSELSEISDGDQGSDFVMEQDVESEDNSNEDSNRKRGRSEGGEGQRKRFKTPEDNEMRRKLRGNNPQDEASRQPSTEGERPSEDLQSEEEEDPMAVPERLVPAEEEAAQKVQLKTCWELIAVLDFLSIFQPYLKLDHLSFSAEELESALVLNNGTSGLLPELHIALMKGISSRSNLHAGNWPTSLAEKLKIYWRTGGLSGMPPFVSQRRREAATYALLPLDKRVSALRILCELRLDREDLHNVVEHALHPPKKTKAERKAIQMALKAGKPPPPEPAMPTMDQMRREPLAQDSSGLLYWYLDYHTTTGTRLYRETPDSLLKAKTKKQQTEPQWELLASSPEQLTELGEKLRRSKKKPDQTLASMILDDIIPELLERREADLRKQRAAARAQSQLTNILPEGEGRSRRARKAVNYSFDAYDAAIRAALRGTSHQDETEGRMTRSQAFLEPRMTAEEEALLGLRRGRSAHVAEPPLTLPPNQRVRPASAAASVEPTPTGTAEPTPEPFTAPSTETSQDGRSAPQSPSPERLVTSEPVEVHTESRGPSSAQVVDSRHESADPFDGGQESAEVEISELGSKDGLYNGGSLEATNEEISSISGGEDMEYNDDLKDVDWR